jgi:hypothetical protein
MKTVKGNTLFKKRSGKALAVIPCEAHEFSLEVPLELSGVPMEENSADVLYSPICFNKKK